ncbi:MAG TPA: hypothetical protein GX708_14830 [Gallicola sp.]|nr:hypothetical protein [Gallicola sp.]
MLFKDIGLAVFNAACEALELDKKSYRLERTLDSVDYSSYKELLMYIIAFCYSVKESECSKYFELPPEAKIIRSNYDNLFDLTPDFTKKLLVFSERLVYKNYTFSFGQFNDMENFCKLSSEVMEIFRNNPDILFR